MDEGEGVEPNRPFLSLMADIKMSKLGVTNNINFRQVLRVQTVAC